MGGWVVWITQESGPPKENYVVQVTYKTSSLNAKTKLLKAEIL
jgi:hypothetical protein